MREVELNFRYKGDRAYIHGTDMYNAVLRVLLAADPECAASAVRFTFHRIATRQCHLLIGDLNEVLVKPAATVMAMIASPPHGQITAFLFETETPVTGRYPYDEDCIAALCVYQDHAIAIQQDSGYTPIETVVAMTKLLHRRLYAAGAGKWLFSRLELQRPLTSADTSRLAIHFGEDLGSGRLTRSTIFCSTTAIGQIYFSVRRP